MREFKHLPKKLRDSISELSSWLPNYDHGPDSFPTTVLRVLAALPGGDELEDMGVEPMGGIGWKEAELLGNMLNAIETKEDVEALAAALTASNGATLSGLTLKVYEEEEEIPKRDEKNRL